MEIKHYKSTITIRIHLQNLKLKTEYKDIFSGLGKLKV